MIQALPVSPALLRQISLSEHADLSLRRPARYMTREPLTIDSIKSVFKPDCRQAGLGHACAATGVITCSRWLTRAV